MSGTAGSHARPSTWSTSACENSTIPAAAGSVHSSVARFDRTNSSASAAVRPRIAQIAG